MGLKHDVIAATAFGCVLALGAAGHGTAEAATIHFDGEVKGRTGFERTWFVHDHAFTAAEGGNFRAALSGGAFDFVRFKLYEDGPGGQGRELVAAFTDSSAFDGLGLALAGLEAGKQYLVRISGAVTGTTIGAYAGSIQAGLEVSPVPLPGAALLFGSGLVSLIAVGRQNRAKRKAAA